MTKFQRRLLIIAGILALVLGMVMAAQIMSKENQVEELIPLFDDFKNDAEHAEGRVTHIYEIDGIRHGGIGHRLVGTELKYWKLGKPVEDDIIDAWFRHDYERSVKGIKRHIENFDGYPRLAQLAILNFAYQLGPDAFSEFHRATDALKEGDWRTAANEWLYADVRTKRWSKWRNETQNRCEQEAERLIECAENGEIIEVQK